MFKAVFSTFYFFLVNDLHLGGFYSNRNWERKDFPRNVHTGLIDHTRHSNPTGRFPIRSSQKKSCLVTVNCQTVEQPIERSRKGLIPRTTPPSPWERDKILIQIIVNRYKCCYIGLGLEHSTDIKKKACPARVAKAGQENIETVHKPKPIQAADSLWGQWSPCYGELPRPTNPCTWRGLCHQGKYEVFKCQDSWLYTPSSRTDQFITCEIDFLSTSVWFVTLWMLW